MSNNKQAGMPSDEQIRELAAKRYGTAGGTIYYQSFIDGYKEAFCPPPKSEAEKEIDLIGAYDKAERFAKFLHDTYESVAKQKGWETQESCRVEFKDLPIKNKQTMIAVAGKILNSEELSRLLSAPSKGKYTEWISIKEKMPENKQRVDVVIESRVGWFRITEVTFKKGKFYKFNSTGYPEQVLHVIYWMPEIEPPLPAAPESSNPETKK